MSNRATLLIGYGRFGLGVLRHFLLSTATRGVLNWESSTQGYTGQRRLKDLVLMSVSDPFEEETSILHHQEGSRFEILRDLYQQIICLSNDDASITQCIKDKTEEMLNAGRRAYRNDALPLGLDVIVIAHPHDRRTFGHLRLLLKDCLIEPLYNTMIQLQHDIGADALNFIQILDFDNYWQRSENAQGLRQNFKAYVENWQQRRLQDKPSFGRIYLVDKLTQNGIREENERIDEISLFIEFLLFENQRTHLQKLYQTENKTESILATFGIRLHERSIGLLKRLAAARFGVEWLDYLESETPFAFPETNHLNHLLDNCEQSVTAETVLIEEAINAAEQELVKLAKDLRQIPIDSQNWPITLETAYQKTIRHFESGLDHQVQLKIQHSLQHLQINKLSQNLYQAIDVLLHDESRPLTLGIVFRQLESVLKKFKPSTEALYNIEQTSNISSNKLATLKTLHLEYQNFIKQQLNINAVLKLWPALLVLLSLAIIPMLQLWLTNWLEATIYDSLTATLLQQYLHTGIVWIMGDNLIKPPQPAHIWFLLFPALLISFIPIYALQKGVNRRVIRAKLFWIHPERGRLTAALNALIKAISQDQQGRIQQIQDDARLSIQNQVSRELSKSYQHLRDRRREITWLRQQLHDFLGLYGLDTSNIKENWNRHSLENGIRIATEHANDFHNILDTNQPIPARFQSVQAVKKPFKNWNKIYSPAFLYPLRFIDELSETFKEHPQTAADNILRVLELRDFLQRHGHDFSTAFSWKTGIGVPEDQVYCLMPINWLHLTEISQTLTDQGISHDDRLIGSDISRTYLLRTKIGVDLGCLTL